jgi:hypothetical protein
MHDNSLKNLRPWTAGQSGNLNGRPRVRLTERFISDVSASWERHGAQILEGMAKREPSRFADLCSRLIPKAVAISIEQRLPGGLSPDDWQLMLEVMGAIKQALPTAKQQQPGEVMQYVLDALNAHSAPLIEDSRDSD